MPDPTISNFFGFPLSLAEQGVYSVNGLNALNARLREAKRTTVIVGDGLCGLALAAGMGQINPGSEHAVVYLTQPASPSRQLIGGATLRWTGLVRLANLFGMAPDTLNRLMGGAVADDLALQRALENGDGSYMFPEPRLSAVLQQPVWASTRHGRILDILRENFPEQSPITLLAGRIPASAEFSAAGVPVQMADGAALLHLPPAHSLVVNAASQTQLLRSALPGAAPDEYVLAIQTPMRARRANSLRSDTQALQLRVPASADHPAFLVFFTPFNDPLSPQADWYGVGSVLMKQEDLSPEAEKKIYEQLRLALRTASDQMDFEWVDPEHTFFQGKAPVSKVMGSALQSQVGNAHPVLHLGAALSAGVPVLSADGMQALAIGTEAFIDAYSTSEADTPYLAALQALKSTDHALEGLRDTNMKNAFLLQRYPEKKVDLFFSSSDTPNKYRKAAIRNAEVGLKTRFRRSLSALKPMTRPLVGR